MLALASRLTCQQSSMLTYTYPASFMPDLTTASAMLLIMSSLTLQANLFHEFQPMGGVSARFADGEGFSCAVAAGTKHSMQKKMVNGACRIFMQTFYQMRLEIGRLGLMPRIKRVVLANINRIWEGHGFQPCR